MVKIEYKIGDCRELIKELPVESIHLVVTSPPYNVGTDYGEFKDNLEFNEYLKMLKEVWIEIKRVLVVGGRIAVNTVGIHRNPYRPLDSYINVQLCELGFYGEGHIIWYKQGSNDSDSTKWGSWCLPSNPALGDVHEFISIYRKDERRRPMPDDKEIVEKSKLKSHEFMIYRRSVWTFSSYHDSDHPSSFPDELPRRLIKLYTFIGDTVLDPFLGSGTTLKVCRELGRNGIGFEINSQFEDIICQKARIGIPDITTFRN